MSTQAREPQKDGASPAARDRLATRLSQLLARTGRIESDLRRPGDRDSEEQATQRQNDEVLEHLDAAERREVEELRAALLRLDSGRYGACERCGTSIQPKRLEVLPATRFCVACADGGGS